MNDDELKNLVGFYIATILLVVFVFVQAMGWPMGLVSGLIFGHYVSKFFIQKIFGE